MQEKYVKKEAFILETPRLYLRKLERSDYGDLCKILQDENVMYAYEHAFSDKEAGEWLERQLQRYADYGFGLWAVICKENGRLIGQCGVTMQDFNGRQVHEIGYLFQKAYWKQGYATEAAAACRDYAFEKLNIGEVFCIIRDTNDASQNVAKRIGMSLCGKMTKHYYGMDMPHVVFSMRRGQ